MKTTLLVLWLLSVAAVAGVTGEEVDLMRRMGFTPEQIKAHDKERAVIDTMPKTEKSGKETPGEFAARMHNLIEQNKAAYLNSNQYKADIKAEQIEEYKAVLKARAVQKGNQ